MIRLPTPGAGMLILLLLAQPLSASELLLVNGNIYTANPANKWAEAIAITGDRIDAVGSNEEIMQLQEAGSRVIDLDRRTVIPGITDSHTHLWLGALALHGFNLATPQVYIEPHQEEALLGAIRAHAAAYPDDPILFGRVQFPDDITLELLDLAVPDRPVVIHNPTEHTYWVNSQALALANITNEPVADPAFEQFVFRHEDGRPTGVLDEAAMLLMDRALPKQPLEERMAWMQEAASYMNRFGITSVVNATGGLDELELYAAMRDQGRLTLRTKTAFGIVGVNHELTPGFLSDLEQARATYDDNWVSANLVKFFANGAGGALLYKPEDYRKLVLELDARGYQIMTHALGEEPVTLILDTYEEAIRVNGTRDRRFRIEHGIRIAADDVGRFAESKVIASMQPDFCCFVDGDNPTNVYKSLLDSGAVVAFGSDWPCTFPPDPFGGIQQSVLRRVRTLFSAPDPVAEHAYVSPGQRLSVEQAVDAYTRGGAYAAFTDADRGSLEAGKLADLAVLTQDIFTVPPELIGNTQAVMTMVGGEIVFDQMR